MNTLNNNNKKERVTMSPSQVTQFLYNLRQTYRELEVKVVLFLFVNVFVD
jgi:hypothetical protein